MKITVTMDHDEWEREKRRIAMEAAQKARLEGYWRAIDDIIQYQFLGECGFGPGVTYEQEQRFYKAARRPMPVAEKDTP